MKRTPDQILRSMDDIAADLVISGLRGQAKRLRRFRTEMTHFVLSENKVPRKIKLSRAARELIENHGLERYFTGLL